MAANWLKTVGIEALKVLQVVVGLAPLENQIVQAVAPQAAPAVNTLTEIAGLAQNVEVSFASLQAQGLIPAGATGAQKAAAIAPLVAQLVQQWVVSSLPGSSKVQDEATFQKGVGEIQQGVVDVLNSLQATVITASPLKP